MSKRAIGMLAATSVLVGGIVFVVHDDQKKDKERMSRTARMESAEDKRKRECAESGGPCEMKPPSSSTAS